MFSDRQVLIYHFYKNGLIESEISKKTKISEQEVEKEYFNSIDKQKVNEIDLDVMKQIVDFYNEILEK